MVLGTTVAGDVGETFRRRVGELLEAKRWSAGDLGSRAGVSARQVSYILGGQRGVSLGAAVGIARALRVSLDWLCGRPTTAGSLEGDELALLEAFRGIRNARIRANVVEQVRAQADLDRDIG